MSNIENYYMVVYTDQHRKKIKKYRDGILKLVNEKSAELYSDEGKIVHKGGNFKLEFNEDTDEESGFAGNWLVVIQKKIPKEDFVSGRCYNPNYIPTGEEKPNNRCPIALAGSSAGLIVANKKKPFSNPILPQQLNASSSSAQGQIPQNASTFKQAPLMKKFMNPLGMDKQDSQKAIPEKAHILCSRDQDPHVKYTCFIDEFLMEQLMPHQVAGIQFMFDCVVGK